MHDPVKTNLRAVEMTQWVKGLATKHDDLGSVTGSHMVEGENQLLLVTQPLPPPQHMYMQQVNVI